MIKITLITLGKLKEKYLADAVAEYKKRLSRYANFETAEVEPVKLPDNPSRAQIEAALAKEAEMILKKVPANAMLITTCIEGTQIKSEDFAAKLAEATAEGRPIAFVIGSSYGLAESLKAKSDLKLSFSKMTFPHQLFRVMFLEQLYRAFKINEGSQYHK